MKTMKVYICTDSKGVRERVYTSLVGACEELGVSYDSAARGKRLWLDLGGIPMAKEIKDAEVVRISGRGINSFK